ncbi:MFS general substrate transporter [Trametes cingulata]|nr:MFS general substrate transporter [Trametes cingulata]
MACSQTAVSTALPTIVSHLNGTDFIWAGTAYTIASTAVVPLVGNLVSGFGRKPVLLSFILVFAVGSAISGAAQNMSMLIAGRAIQGFGGGGCISITEIIYADMVPLPERGKFQGIVATAWALACAFGPLVGRAFANSGAWRWLFFLNLPIPRFFFTDRTTLSGYLGTFFHGLVAIIALYTTSPCTSRRRKALVGGLSVRVINRYCPQNYVGWSIMIVGFGLVSLLDENTSRALYIGLQIPLAVGLGIIAHALAFFTFFRCFVMSWGIVIGGTILQGKLLHTLPPDFRATLPQGVQIAYAAIPSIPTLDEPLRSEVRAAFAQAMRLIWRIMIGISGAWLLTCLLMSEVELRKDSLDEKWGLQDDSSGRDEETKGELTVASSSEFNAPTT